MKANAARIAIITPFLDKSHGSERCLAEQVERLARHYPIRIYTHRVDGLDLSSGNISVRRIPSVPGPHLIKYAWFFVANHIWRSYDTVFRGARYAVRYSPCINCLDANVIAVHIVFHARAKQMAGRAFSDLPLRDWPRSLHRKIYFGLIMSLERLIYRNCDLVMIYVSNQVSAEMREYFGRSSGRDVVIYHGVAASYFNPADRRKLRAHEREKLGIADSDFVLLLIGNDWTAKGLPTLVDAIARLGNPKFKAVVVGRDSLHNHQRHISRARLDGRILFLPPSDDVLRFYAVADAYVGASLEDAFAMPPMEAMACGLPVIVSRRAGVSELVTDGHDGLILNDPTDSEDLAAKIARLGENSELARELGEQGSRTVRRYTWDENAMRLEQTIAPILAGDQ
jgi:glycosyltransferase involved in cell wall biosynthesis